jgi:succinate-semialdehyde dehydrogenase / glutarate-semialdehyde dehydrogenase
MTSVQISTNPYNLKENLVQTNNTLNELETIINQASLSAQTYSKSSLEYRIETLRKLRSVFNDSLAEIAKTITLEIGCPLIQTQQEAAKVIQIFDYYIDNAHQYLANEIVSETQTSTKYIKYEAIGTVLHIAPYNYPFYLALRPLIPSILVGNTNILKTPSQTPMLGKLINELVIKSGIDAGILKVVFVAGSDMESLIADKRINLVCLIGSEKAGSIVASVAGKYLKKSLLELGGNDAMIVMPDGDLNKVVDGIVASRIRNSGQSCNAVKRVIAHSKIHDELVGLLTEKLKALVFGDPCDEATTFGPLANLGSLEVCQLQVNNSIAKGAKLIYGGGVNHDYGYFYEPTILTNVSSDQEVFYEEVFAPVIPFTKFDTIEEALELANNSEYGLGGSIWTQDKIVIDTVINQLYTGTIAVNGIVRGDPMMPFGGVKKSGYGREFGSAGLYEFCNIKSIAINK